MMSLAFGNIKMKLNIFNNNTQLHETNDIEEINMIDAIISDTFEDNSTFDPLEACLIILSFTLIKMTQLEK